MDNIVADSTFYIFFFDDIKCANHLNCILDSYGAYIGPTIRSEIGHYLETDKDVNRKITVSTINVDFQNILDQYQISLLSAFPNLKRWDKKGEFEAIGISYFLKESGNLKYLIVDDSAPYKSKFLIDREINHLQLFNDSYMDVQHDQALREHEKSMKQLMKEIIIIPQSGIRTVESFHSFVASINQSGSLPFLNQ